MPGNFCIHALKHFPGVERWQDVQNAEECDVVGVVKSCSDSDQGTSVVAHQPESIESQVSGDLDDVVAHGALRIGLGILADGLRAVPVTPQIRDQHGVVRLAKQRKAAFAAPPTRPNQVWQFDFSEYETTGGGTWRVAGVADYFSKYEFGWHWSPTANQHDAIAGVELALAEAEAMLDGVTLIDHLTDPETGEIVPITLVTDNAGPFRSFRFEHFITAHPELRHIRTRVRTPGQNGVRERAFQSLKYERLYREQIDDALDLAREADAYRAQFNTIRPHEALACNRPSEVQRGLADPTIPTFPEPEILPTT